MTAVAAHVFRVPPSRGNVSNVVARGHANHRMTDDARRRVVLQERMAAVAGIFDETVSRRHTVDVMAEQSAEVTNLLPELAGGRVGIGICREHKRVSAL